MDLAPAQRVGTQVPQAWNGAPVALGVAFPLDPALAGLVVHAQGGFLDGATGSIRLTNALRVELGTP